MIPNITHSTDSGNYLGYDLGDKREQYQKVQFLAAEGVMLDDRLIDRLNQNWDDGDEKGYQAFRKVSMAIANDLDDQFQAQASLNGRPKIRAINVSLSYSPEDTDKVNEVVYDEAHDDYVPLRLKLGREFLDGMGFGDIQYMAVSHLGTHCAHDHYAINTIRADGSTIKLKFDFVRAQKIAEEIRQKYGLTPPDESLQMIAPKAKDALKQSCSWEEYEQRLQEHGISLFFSDHSKNGRGYGVSYSFGKKVIPGSKLHRSLSYGQVEAALARNLAARAEKLAGEPETFVIHNDNDATLYSNRPSPWPKNLEKLHEAARSILKYHTWGASVRCNEPDEFIEDAMNGQQFGTVTFNMKKARYVGGDRSDGMLENPDEVIQFADHKGQALDLFTPEFWDYWRLQLEALKNWLARLSKKTPTVEPVEKAPAPVPQQEPQKQQEAPAPAAKPNPVATPASAPEVAPAPAHQPTAAPAAQVTRPVTQVAQQQTAPTPPPAAKTYEVVKKFTCNYYPYRIKKEQDGLMKLQKLDVDRKSPVVDGKHTGHLWYTKEKFTSYEEVGHDSNGVYFKIKDTAGKTRYINQNGVDLDAKKKKQLGLVSQGFGGPTM